MIKTNRQTEKNVKQMFINSMTDESRVAIVKDNVLTELSVEQTAGSNIKGNIYSGQVVSVQESINAAFVEFGERKHGFLALDEVDFDAYSLINTNSERRNIRSRLRVGQSVLVQAIREPTETKGAALTTFVSLPGMYLVFSPKKGESGISKKIQDEEERERLKSFISGIAMENNSVIIRTAGIGKNLNDLKKEYVSLKSQWSVIHTAYTNAEKPQCIYTEEGNTVRMIRDYYSDDIETVWIDNPETLKDIHVYFRRFLPAQISKIRLYMGEKPIFYNFGIEKQIENLSDSKFPLPSGGSIVIQQTEALVAIDVNSGRSNQENFSEKTALRTNLEAAEEVARQLRLRNLAGLVVIDFIDMKSADDRSRVETTVQKAMEDDKASHNIGNISQFGLLELSRQRLSQGYAITMEDKCPHCKGSGREPNKITYTNNILRKIKNLATDTAVKTISMVLPAKMAVYLLNNKRNDLYDIEMALNVSVSISASNDMSNAEDISFKLEKQETETKSPYRKNTRKEAPVSDAGIGHHADKPADTDKRSSEQSPASHAESDEKPRSGRKTEPAKRAGGKSGLSGKPSKKPDTDVHQDLNKTEEFAPSCLFKDLPEIDVVESGLMDTFYGVISGRVGENTDIFFDDKYLLDISSTGRPTPVSDHQAVWVDIEANRIEEHTDAHDPTADKGNQTGKLRTKTSSNASKKSGRQRKSVTDPVNAEMDPTQTETQKVAASEQTAKTAPKKSKNSAKKTAESDGKSASKAVKPAAEPTDLSGREKTAKAATAKKTAGKTGSVAVKPSTDAKTKSRSDVVSTSKATSMKEGKTAPKRSKQAAKKTTKKEPVST